MLNPELKKRGEYSIPSNKWEQVNKHQKDHVLLPYLCPFGIFNNRPVALASLTKGNMTLPMIGMLHVHDVIHHIRALRRILKSHQKLTSQIEVKLTAYPRSIQGRLNAVLLGRHYENSFGGK